MPIELFPKIGGEFEWVATADACLVLLTSLVAILYVDVICCC